MDQRWEDQHEVLQSYIMEISKNLQVLELGCSIQIVHTCMANSVHGSVENIYLNIVYPLPNPHRSIIL